MNTAAQKGFTLVEILISVSIFVFVMTVALGALLAMSESNRRVETMKSVINTLNFSLDSMSRSIRTGINYRCASSGTLPLSCSSGGSALTFLGPDPAGGSVPNAQTVYCRGTVPPSGSPSCDSSGTAILRSIDAGVSFSAITSKEVIIESLQFFVLGAEPPGSEPGGVSLQPKVTILLTGAVITSGGGTTAAACGTTAQCSKFNLQTSVTQRIYDQ